MLGSEFLGNLYSGLGDFAKSGIGQTAIGAGLGYGVDRLSGGNGGVGAIAGGALGGLNAMSGLGAGQSFSDAGQDAYSNSFLGGLGNNTTNQAAHKLTGKEMLGANYKPSINDVVSNPNAFANYDFSNMPAGSLGTNASHLEGLGSYFKKGLGYINNNQPAIKTGLDAFGAYNQYQDNANKARLSQEQLDMIRHQNALAEQKYKSDIARRGQVENNASSAFNNSKLASYY